MKVTGYALRDALKQHELLRETAASEFSGSFKRFPDESKALPVDIAKRVQGEEEKIAQLQSAQAVYNTRVRLTVEGQTLTLTEGIKLMGGAARIEKMWKGALPTSGNDQYRYRDETRDPNEIRAVATMATDEILHLALASGKRSAAFRTAISVANATEVEIENLDSSLFE